MTEFYNLVAKKSDGSELNFSDLKGNMVLIVNVASKCGFAGQYVGLQKLYEKYGKIGLVILGFPCNQFLNQEPGTNEEIVASCQKDYGVEFPIMEKIDVNVENAHPVYQYLKSHKK